MNTNLFVKKAVENTPKGYAQQCARQRIYGPDARGSVYITDLTPEAFFKSLGNCNWVEINDPNIAPGCKGFTTKDLKNGHFGMISISDLPADTRLEVFRAKEGAGLSVQVKGTLGPAQEETTIIIGDDGDGWIVFTFYCGPTIPLKEIDEEIYHEGDIITPAQAIKAGWDWAKIDYRP